MATHAWEIVTYGGGEFLNMIFNGVAMIFGNGDYIQGMNVAALIAFLGLFIRAAFDREMFTSIRWFFTLLVFIMAVLTPKVPVMITDKINPTKSSVVANIPLGLALTASGFSTLGDFLTKSFETVFSLPDNLNYSTTGLLFANSLIETSDRFIIPDGRTNENFSEFVATCVIVDGLGNNRFTWNEITAAPNLVSFFATRVAKWAAHFRYIKDDGQTVLLPCREGWTDWLVVDLESQYDDILKRGLPPEFIQRFGGLEAAKNKMNATMAQAFNYTAGISANPSDLVIQQAIINSMANGAHKLSQQVDAGAFAEYIHSGAELQRMNAFQVYGKLAGEKLPLLRIIFEGSIYAIFPFVVLMAIVSPVKVSMSYVQGLAWINVWSMLYAILHFIITFFTHAIAPSYAAEFGGLTIIASHKILNFNADIIGTTGYLAMSIPMLAWMLISRSGAMMAGIAGRVMQGYDKSVDSGANEVVKGGGQRLGYEWAMTNAGGIQQTSLDNSGTQFTQHADGFVNMQQAKSDMHISGQVASSVLASAQSAKTEAAQLEQQARAENRDAVQAAFADSTRVLEELRNKHGASNTYQQAETALHQEAYSNLEAKYDEWAKKGNLSNAYELKDQVLQYVKAEMGVGTPGGLPVKANAAMGVTRTDHDTFTAVSQDVKELAARFTQSDNYNEVLQSMVQAVRGMAADFELSKTDGTVQALDASLEKVDQTSRAVSDSVSRSETAEVAFNQANQLASTLTTDGGRAFLQIAYDAGMGHDEVNRLLITAAGPASPEQKAAMGKIQEIYTAAIQNTMPQPEQFGTDHLDKMYAGGRQKVDESFEKGSTGVNRTADRNEQTVLNQSQVDKERVVATVAHTQATVLNSMEDVESVRVHGDRLAGHKERIEAGGAAVQANAAIPDTHEGRMEELERAKRLNNLGMDPNSPLPQGESGKPLDQMSPVEREAEALRDAYRDPHNNDPRVRRF